MVLRVRCTGAGRVDLGLAVHPPSPLHPEIKHKKPHYGVQCHARPVLYSAGMWYATSSEHAAAFERHGGGQQGRRDPGWPPIYRAGRAALYGGGAARNGGCDVGSGGRAVRCREAVLVGRGKAMLIIAAVLLVAEVGMLFVEDVRPFIAGMRPFMAEMRPFAAEMRPFMAEMRPFMAEMRPFMAEIRPLMGAVLT
eukprot:989655-Rhodomonas_salina.1